MTPVLSVITDYCEQYVDDEILTELQAESAPLYFWKMWGKLNAAIPYFNVPPEMTEYLLGTETSPKLVKPKYDNLIYTVDTEQTASFTIALGEDYKNYELCSCRTKTVLSNGTVILTPLAIVYNSTLGTVTISASVENPLLQGTILDFDFYTDGYFHNTVTPTMGMILGFCFELVWNIRLAENWLDRKPKIEDKSFSQQNIANKQNSDTARIEEIRKRLAREMANYEQNCYYSQVMTGSKLKRLI